MNCVIIYFQQLKSLVSNLTLIVRALKSKTSMELAKWFEALYMFHWSRYTQKVISYVLSPGQ